MRVAALAACVTLAACSGTDPGNTVDVSGAANQAESDIANYAARTATPATRPAKSAVAPAAARALKKAAASPPASVAPATPVDPTSAQAAADVVRRYYAAIEAGRYREAWALWNNGGAAAGVSADAFAASFAPYASYHAEVGVPFGEDAGAGQRYIQVPVRISGALRSGQSFALAGALTLHRVAEGIDTPDPASHLWRIDRSDVKPAP